jgi:hypothetical protein
VRLGCQIQLSTIFTHFAKVWMANEFNFFRQLY